MWPPKTPGIRGLGHFAFHAGWRFTVAEAMGQRVGHHTLTQTEWEKLQANPDFQDLYRRKVRAIVPLTIIFLVYYFALPVSVGYFPSFMETKVIGDINLAYLFALSEFVMAWIITAIYVQLAKRWDVEADAIIAKVRGGAQ
jgi:uncharacterized membrane protein (DUF485 family)